MYLKNVILVIHIQIKLIIFVFAKLDFIWVQQQKLVKMVNLANYVMLVIKLVKIVTIVYQMIALNAISMLLYQNQLL